MGGIADVTEQGSAQQALEKSEEKYRLLVEHQNDLVVEVDEQGYFVFVNSNYCEAFGRTPEDLLGQRFMPLVHGAPIPVPTNLNTFW